MKYLFILISFLLSIQFSSATEKEYTLQNGNTVLAVSKDGKLLSLQTGNIRYLSLNAPYVVTLEVNAETLNGYYTSVKRKEESLVCIAKLKSVRGTVFHVKDTFFGLLVPSLMMSAFNVLLMKSYFVTGVPDEILEAAYIDGANEFQTMWKIAIPLSKPIITTVAMFSGIAYWNDWNNGYIYLTKRTDLYSIQNLLNRLMQNIQALTQNANNMAQAGEGLSQIPSGTVRMAMAALGILPIMIIYPFIQKNFVKGITLGGVKG